ncbi:MAG: helix-turn-helix domain-containing protein [Clostridiales bacterium]|nr:helix-turn-helix domain-containing protein [Clostridiales bacterium]
MELHIIGSPEEIAALLLELRRQPAEPDADTIEFVGPYHAEAPAEIPVRISGNKDLIANIEAERARAGLSRAEFVRKLGIARQTLYNWYAGGSIPWARLQQIADLFQIDVLALMGIK